MFNVHSMKTLAKYRMSGLLLAMVFCLFNVGLPIVIASCPMVMNEQAPVCPACVDQPGAVAEKLTKATNTSCCTTVIAVEKKTTEFVQSKQNRSELAKSYETSALLKESVNLYHHSFDLQILSPSPPLWIDIPVLTSSLLI